MSKTYYEHTVGFTVLDMEDLPDGLSPSDVYAKVSEVVAEALGAWYADGGQELLACEPEC